MTRAGEADCALPGAASGAAAAGGDEGAASGRSLGRRCLAASPSAISRSFSRICKGFRTSAQSPLHRDGHANAECGRKYLDLQLQVLNVLLREGENLILHALR